MYPILPPLPPLSIAVSGRDKPQFFDSQRPINRVLGFGHGLRFSGSLARYRMVRI